MAVPTISGQPRPYQGLELVTQRLGSQMCRIPTFPHASMAANLSGMGIKRRDRVITVNGSQGSLGLRLYETSCVLFTTSSDFLSQPPSGPQAYIAPKCSEAVGT